jgi:hypothetical protein
MLADDISYFADATAAAESLPMREEFARCASRRIRRCRALQRMLARARRPVLKPPGSIL